MALTSFTIYVIGWAIGHPFHGIQSYKYDYLADVAQYHLSKSARQKFVNYTQHQIKNPRTCCVIIIYYEKGWRQATLRWITALGLQQSK